jgi:hypothetical protein
VLALALRGGVAPFPTFRKLERVTGLALETVVDREVHPVWPCLYAGREQAGFGLATHEASGAQDALGFRGLFLA